MIIGPGGLKVRVASRIRILKKWDDCEFQIVCDIIPGCCIRSGGLNT